MIRLGEVGSNRSELCVGFSQEFNYYSNHNGKPRDGFMQRSDLALYLKNKTVLFKTHRERRTRYVLKDHFACCVKASASHINSLFPHLHLDSILKSRDITLPTKVHLAKAVVFQ